MLTNRKIMWWPNIEMAGRYDASSKGNAMQVSIRKAHRHTAWGNGTERIERLLLPFSRVLGASKQKGLCWQECYHQTTIEYPNTHTCTRSVILFVSLLAFWFVAIRFDWSLCLCQHKVVRKHCLYRGCESVVGDTQSGSKGWVCLQHCNTLFLGGHLRLCQQSSFWFLGVL